LTPLVASRTSCQLPLPLSLPPSLPPYLRGRGQDLRARDVFKAIDQDVGVGVAPGEGAVFLGREGGREGGRENTMSKSDLGLEKETHLMSTHRSLPPSLPPSLLTIREI
jgi:hypothetical protein